MKTKKIKAPQAAKDLNGDGRIDDWEIEQSLKTLMDAEKIKADPVKMKKVNALAGRHHKALKSIKSVQDLKDTYKSKFGKKEE